MFETPPQPFGKSIFEASIECGDACYYAKRGYVYVIADLRGIGHSEGIMEGMFSRHEGEDGHDMVEWLAQQPWCDGNVGLAGICYFSSMQLHTAAEQPPHLKCIAPWEIFGDDLYNHGQYEGGVHQHLPLRPLHRHLSGPLRLRAQRRALLDGACTPARKSSRRWSTKR